MAAKPHTPLPDDRAAVPPIAAFVDEVTHFFRVAWAMHAGAGSADAEIRYLLMFLGPAKNGSPIHRAIRSLQSSEDTATSAVASLLRDCAKIGGDLFIRIDRVAAKLSLRKSEAGLRKVFCKTWKPNDLAVLAARLEFIVQRFADIDGLSVKQDHVTAWKQNLTCRLDGKPVIGDEYDNGDDAAAEAERRTRERIEAETKPAKPKRDAGLSKDAAKRMMLANRPKQASAGILNDFLLESLAYRSMHDREDEVTEAHGSTFDWVFKETPNFDRENSKLGIREWLSTEESGPMYWITGKPGSGKSTFIRYLYQHRQTTECIQSWAGEKHVAMAGFFFWTSGSREQRSQTGLLRSLLHQLLSENPELIPSSFPELWARLLDMPTKERIKFTLDWTVSQLLAAFLLFVKTASTTMKICLFIDGMDEFEGDHQTMIDLFKSLSLGDAGNDVKMCLSSRPWTVFQDAFEGSVPNLRLQDLTYGDMYRYVSENLADCPEMCDLLESNVSAAKDLVSDTIEQADGVFLWVRLATEKILERFKVDDGLEGVANILKSLPGDLDDLFYKLLFEDLDASEITETASIYSLMRARESVADFVRNDSANSLRVWEFAFALWKNDDKMMNTSIGVKRATDEFVGNRNAETIDLVKRRFCGLLDFHAKKREGMRVIYIHRTVRDWLISCDGIHEKLLGQLPSDFDPNLRLLRSYVLQMKRPKWAIRHERMLDDWWPDITIALTHARNITNDPENLQRAFVNELDNVITWWWGKRADDPYDHWARNAFGSYEMRMTAPPIWRPFLALTVRFGLRKYVGEELTARNKTDEDGIDKDQEALRRDDATPLLAYATEFLCSRMKTIYPLSDPGFVEDLLRSTSQINPGVNHEYTAFVTRAPMTPWISMLRHLRDARRRRWIKLYDTEDEGTRRWVDIVKLFLEVGGSDASALVQKDRWDSEITAEGVFELLDETYAAVEIQEAKEVLRQLRSG